MWALLATSAVLSMATGAAATAADRPDLRDAAAQRSSGPRVPPPPGSRRAAEARPAASASAAAPAVRRRRWGESTGARWWAGDRAPGGWEAYRRPLRGWALPTYWVSPDWRVNDWATYGLPRPPEGYVWSRHYDDAVLIDPRGSVYDTIGGVEWDQHDDVVLDYVNVRDLPGYDGLAYSTAAAAPGTSYDAPRPSRAAARDSCAGGAAIGAAAGGVAGAAVAGGGNRVGGALIGGGVGAATGYAVDKAEDRGRVPPPPPPPPQTQPRYGADYPPPPSGYVPPLSGYAPEPGGYPPAVATRATSYPPAVASRAPAYPPAVPPAPAGPVVTAGPGTRVISTTTTTPAPGYYADGYYYPGTSITTITVESQPVTSGPTTTRTTTTTTGVR
ncbi:RcnB family protein [Sphingomonas sp.]|jgi:Ni/Co efflux regulator RcnB|uniref:RcnB family protein n=1 Tax=Sphingomonas sp. TaxID=28214 RepID=UPI00262DB6CB|nr:RcnB family protein [Sphingomonas sp.]MDF2494081.1 hypothetical protein [Sphingomonas sp.]